MPRNKVLVVDDDRDVVVYLSMLLEDNDYEVQTADSSRAVQKILESFTPDVIIVDVMMPGGSGLNLLVKLRHDPRFGQTPIMFVTGNDQIIEEGGESYLDSYPAVKGPDGVLGKPILPEAFLALVAKLTAG